MVYILTSFFLCILMYVCIFCAFICIYDGMSTCICVCVCSYSSMTIRGSRCTILAIVKGDVQVDNGRCTGYLFLKHIRLCIY